MINIELKRHSGIWYHKTDTHSATSIIKSKRFIVVSGGNQRFSEGIYFMNHPNSQQGDILITCRVSGKFIDFSTDTFGSDWRDFKASFKWNNYTDLTRQIQKEYPNADGILFSEMLVVWNVTKISIQSNNLTEGINVDTEDLNESVKDENLYEILKNLLYEKYNNLKVSHWYKVEYLGNVYDVAVSANNKFLYAMKMKNLIIKEGFEIRDGVGNIISKPIVDKYTKLKNALESILYAFQKNPSTYNAKMIDKLWENVPNRIGASNESLGLALKDILEEYQWLKSKKYSNTVKKAIDSLKIFINVSESLKNDSNASILTEGTFSYDTHSGKIRGKFNIYQGRNGKIYIVMGNNFTELIHKQIVDLNIDVYSLKDFDTTMYRKAYGLGQ